MKRIKEYFKWNYIILLLILTLPIFQTQLLMQTKLILTVILITLSAYHYYLKGGIITAFWLIFTLRLNIILEPISNLILLVLAISGGIYFKRQAKLKEDLEQEKEKIDKILETTAEGLWILDQQGNFLRSNSAYQQMIGYTEEELLKLNLKDISNSSEAEMKKELQRVVTQGSYSFENKHSCKDGSLIDLEMNMTYLSNLKQPIFAVFGRDITERKEIEERLRTQKNKLQKLLDTTEAFVVVLDLDYNLISMNKKTKETFDFNLERVLGMHMSQFTTKEDYQQAETVLDEMFKKSEAEKDRSKIVEVLVTEIKNIAGETRKIGWRATGLENESGEIDRILCTGLDVTSILELEKELEESKTKVEFFASLSHDLKTPLNLISSAQQMLGFHQKDLDLELATKLTYYNKLIKQNSYRLLRLIDNLLDINRINSDSFELELDNYDIVRLVKEIVNSVKPYITDKKREFIFKKELQGQILACDAFNIERALLNLLSNAVKFTDIGDKIVVKIYRVDDKVRISIKDTGVGIPADKQETIFNRFGQTNNSLTRKNEGTGIGLSLVQLIVDLHQGDILLNSEVEVGSEFIIELPIRVVKSSDKADSDYDYQNTTERIDLEFSDIYNL